MSLPKPYYQDDLITVVHGNCLDVMKEMEAESVDSIVTDPPYGLSFMGKEWDHGVPGVPFWVEALRIAKPGAFLLAFGGTRTFHRLTVAIEDAGWEIRDCVMWVYGSGFPKSLDVSKAIDRAAGAEREVVGVSKNLKDIRRNKSADIEAGWDNGQPKWVGSPNIRTDVNITSPATDEARQWQGGGTALKPAWEPIIVARKPIVGTVANNVLKHGVGGLNIDGCRIETGDDLNGGGYSGGSPTGMFDLKHKQPEDFKQPSGRFPANFIHDGSQEVMDLFPNTKSGGSDGKRTGGSFNTYGRQYERDVVGGTEPSSGSAARFFYCAKASKRDRDEGLEDMELKAAGGMEGRNDGSIAGCFNA